MTDIRMVVARDGQVFIEEGELPDLPPGHVQVRTLYSAISAGTELMGLRGSKGITDRSSALGYQLGGEVVAVAPDLQEAFSPGDKVACYGGPYVRHASTVNVPKHLAAKLPDNVSPRDAAYCGLGSVALHAFRRAGLSLGETAAVIGLGALGNLVAQCAVAAGCRVAAVDTIELRRRAAARCDVPVEADFEAFAATIRRHGNGNGADAVFVVVNFCPDQLLDDAVRLVRHLGNVVIVGTADAKVPRNAMFANEACIMVSRAAGPGRYDAAYEAGGQDYPYAHARWTEGRNLAEFVRLLGCGRLHTAPLVSRMLPATHAATAYQLLADNPSENLGIVLDWTA